MVPLHLELLSREPRTPMLGIHEILMVLKKRSTTLQRVTIGRVQNNPSRKLDIFMARMTGDMIIDGMIPIV